MIPDALLSAAIVAAGAILYLLGKYRGQKEGFARGKILSNHAEAFAQHIRTRDDGEYIQVEWDREEIAGAAAGRFTDECDDTQRFKVIPQDDEH